MSSKDVTRRSHFDPKEVNFDDPAARLKMASHNLLYFEKNRSGSIQRR
ncbi:MAG: hypothetical protein PHH85_02775 [Candidatus Methanoperedens sp.]|nr:hypothetical protein [Candidatus Methanoperedens sp.]